MKGVFVALEKENKFEYYFKPKKIIDEIEWNEFKIPKIHEQGQVNEFFSISFHNYQIAGQIFSFNGNATKKHIIGFLLDENTNPIPYRNVLLSLLSFIQSLPILEEDTVFESVLTNLLELKRNPCVSIKINEIEKEICLEQKKTLYETLKENLWNIL